jgi:hypothetical protein
MSWYDWVTLVIMATVTAVQTIRGIRAGGVGLPLFEAACMVVAASAATYFAPGLAGPFHARESTMMLALFMAFSFIAFVVARWLFALTGLTFHAFDGVLSLFCGVVMAWVVAHMFLRIMAGSGGAETADGIASSPIAREVLQFQSWNSLVRWLFKVKGADIDPTES